MRLHHLRNATCVLEFGEYSILIDPMLSEKGQIPSFARFRHKPKRNPTVPLPNNSQAVLEKVTHCLITHSQTFGFRPLQHSDHLDQAGENFLLQKNVPVLCRQADERYLKKYLLRVEAALPYWQKTDLLGGTIIAVPAKHGHGWIHKLMANGAGYFLSLPGEPTVYIAGDTVLTEEVEKALHQLKPDVAVVAAGGASLDFGKSILMDLDEVLRFSTLAPGRVVANHLEALNHCPITRNQLREALTRKGLIDKVNIPEDGEILEF